MSKFCTYISQHPSGFYYIGKGVTDNVLSGKYKGSGVRFKLSLRHPNFAWDTWQTTVLNTYDTEETAYAAEEVLVDSARLMDPFCMNMTLGGSKGKYRTHSSVLKSLTSAEKKQRTAEARLRRAQRVAAKREKERRKTAQLKQLLKKTK